MQRLKHYLSKYRYFGRGILIGKSQNHLFLAYFLSGRSKNSQNRILYAQDKNIHIQIFKPEDAEDTSLIFYPPILHFQRQIIVSNGDQTQTILDYLKRNQSFEDALRTREFEPDSPHFTPRISALITLHQQDFSYKMSLLKAQKATCVRFFYEYTSLEGVGHFLHTYQEDTSPLTPFQGEPIAIQIPSSLEILGDEIWNHLNKDYKISLCVQSLNLTTHETQTLLYNTKESQCKTSNSNMDAIPTKDRQEHF